MAISDVPPVDQMSPQGAQGMMDEAAILSFIDDLIRDKNDPAITAENLEEVKSILLEEVNNAINTHLVNLLAEQDQIELDSLLDTDPTDEQLNAFFLQKIPNLEIEIAAALLNFRSAYLYPVTQPDQPSIQPQYQSEPQQEYLPDESMDVLPAPLLPDNQ